ncbi:MAG: DUF1810 domain-containing protein [Lachnospiraceae bacterium]|nr:DUF1810 domain-containing protein [Lachnospiraceae bacterium]
MKRDGRGLRPASKTDAGHILESSDAEEVMGWPDNLKLRSSMTLFLIADPGCDVFQKVLDKYFGEEKDPKTIAILGVAKSISQGVRRQ